MLPLRMGDFGKLGEFDVGAAEQHADALARAQFIGPETSAAAILCIYTATASTLNKDLISIRSTALPIT